APLDLLCSSPRAAMTHTEKSDATVTTASTVARVKRVCMVASLHALQAFRCFQPSTSWTPVLRSISLKQMSRPPQLVPKRAIVALPANLNQLEGWRRPHDLHTVAGAQLPQRTAIHHDRCPFARLRDHNFVHTIGGIHDRSDRQRM